jgi:hypothetical protein
MPGRRRIAVLEAWALMMLRMEEVFRTGEEGLGELMRMRDVEGERLWWRIWDSTAYCEAGYQLSVPGGLRTMVDEMKLHAVAPGGAPEGHFVEANRRAERRPCLP